MRSSSIVCVASLLFAVGCASAAPRTDAVMPLRSLRLYETGVGYFERSGPLPDGDDPALVVPSGHLDDALKTLVVLGPNGQSQIGGFELGSRLSGGMARAMAGLPMEEGAPITYKAILSSLVGSQVQVGTPEGLWTGRLIAIEDVASPKGPDKDKDKDSDSAADEASSAARFELTVLTADARVVRVTDARLGSVRPTDPAQAKRLDAALEALLAHGPASHHRLRLLGTPGTPVTLGYIAETPVWRTNYRIVLGTGADKPVLQAWALLHNDTDEDWRGVRLDLVNGRPDSFLFPLAAPRYERRELATPENELSTVPQLMDSTPDSLWGDHLGESFGAGGLGLSGVGEGGGGYGSGVGLGTIGTIGHGSGTSGSSSLLEVGNLASIAQAEGTESGALFVYKMPKPLSLRSHASALVPFLQQPVEADSIAWFESVNDVGRRGVVFVNSTTQTLPPGTIAFYADGGFAGESAIDRMRPKERRFLTFGADLDVEVTQKIIETKDAPERLRSTDSVLEEHFVRTTSSHWTIVNRSRAPREVYVKIAMTSNATITGSDRVDFEKEAGKPLVVFHVAPHQTIERDLLSKEGLVKRSSFRSLSAEDLTRLASATTLAPEGKALASAALPVVQGFETDAKRLIAAKAELEQIDEELGHLREDAKAVGDRGAMARPLVERIVAAEDRKAALRKEIAQLEKAGVHKDERLRVLFAPAAVKP